MLKNYVVVAFRNLKRHKFFSLINIFGLALSMSVCLGIIMLVADQVQNDRHISKRDDIFRINTRYLNGDGSSTGNDYATAPLALGVTLKENIAGVEKVVRIKRGFGNSWIEFDQDISIPLGGFFADPEILDVFELELEHGDPTTALKDPYCVVLTQKAAKKLFRQDNPVGEVIKVGELGEYKVTGVLKDTQQKSHIIYEALASYSTIQSLEANNTFNVANSGWGNFTSGWVYVLLNKDTELQTFQKTLDVLATKNKPEKRMGNEDRLYSFYPQNLCNITPGPFINNPIGPFMPRIFVYFFGGLAMIVMLTSCFNYTNLSIARALTRAKEIGVRKVNGANRWQIFIQFMSESVVLSLLALAAALVLLIAVKPFLLNLKFAQVLKWDLEGNYFVYALFLAFSVLVGVLAGLFPSLILSRFEPMRVLKKVGSVKLFSRLTVRKSLLVFQFTLSLVFIISVILLYNQLTLFIKADHGFEMSENVVVKLNNTSWEKLQTELSTYNNIINSSAASHVPAAGVTYGEAFKRSLAETEVYSFDYYNVDANYLENLSIPLVAGRGFDPDAGAGNQNSILINEEGVRELGFKSPLESIGETMFNTQDSSSYQIIGVVRNYNHQVLMAKIEPMALIYKPEEFNILQVKYTGSRENAVEAIEKSWAKINPVQKIDFKDFEDEVRGFYKTVFSDFVSIIGVISFMAIVISCLGLLGMATYASETRMKEISIRKVLGSSSTSLVMLLSKGFLVLLVIAIIVAIPLSWFLNNLWLQHIAYRTSFTFEVVATGILILMGLGMLTIGSQTLKAAFSNPVNSLKNE